MMARLTMASNKKWKESDTLKFVQLYEEAECLWNFRHPTYKHRTERVNAMNQIIEEMNIPNFGVHELKNKIKNIRSTYQQEVNKIRRSKPNFGGDIFVEYKTNLAWFPVAHRFLSKVICSAKNATPNRKIQKDANFQSNQSLYNLVETEMNNDDADIEENFKTNFSPLIVNVHNIKEEVNSDDDADDGVLENTPSSNNDAKKRKLNNSIELNYDNLGAHLSESSEILPPNSLDDLNFKDEFYHFSNNIACQLRELPLKNALICQKKIIELLTQERISCILNTEASSSAKHE